jgi:hypothetical protein
MTEPQVHCSKDKWQQKCMIQRTKGEAFQRRGETVALMHVKMHRARQQDGNGAEMV